MKRTRISLAILLAVSVITSCSGNTETATKVPEASTTTKFTDASTTTTPSEKCFSGLRDPVREWNTVSGIMLNSYTNDNISVEETVEVFDVNLPVLTETVDTIESIAGPCRSDAVISDVLESYEQKLAGYIALRDALVIRSADAVQDALDSLTRANDLSVSSTCTFLERLGEPKPSKCP